MAAYRHPDFHVCLHTDAGTDLAVDGLALEAEGGLLAFVHHLNCDCNVRDNDGWCQSMSRGTYVGCQGVYVG